MIHWQVSFESVAGNMRDIIMLLSCNLLEIKYSKLTCWTALTPNCSSVSPAALWLLHLFRAWETHAWQCWWTCSDRNILSFSCLWTGDQSSRIFAPVCVSVQRGLMLGLIIRAFVLASLSMGPINEARWGRTRASAGAATYCQSNLWRYPWVGGSLLTTNQLSLAGKVKHIHELLRLIKLITNRFVA